MSKLLSALAAKHRKKMKNGGPVQQVEQKSQTPVEQRPKATFWQDLKYKGWLGPNDMREEQQRRIDLQRPKDSQGNAIMRSHMPIMQAEGGEVDKKDVKKKIEKKKGPDIRKGSTFKSRPVDEDEILDLDPKKVERVKMRFEDAQKPTGVHQHTMQDPVPSKEKHKQKLEELRKMPKPKLADGGEIHIDINSHKNDMEEMAEGGEIEDLGGHTSLADAIMAEEEPERDHMLELNAVEQPNNEDQLSFEALKKEIYSEDEALDQLDQPEDSNLHSPEHEDMDEHDEDLVQLIRRRLKKSPSME